MDDNTVQMFMNTCSPFTAPSARYHARGAVRGTRIGPRLEENTVWSPPGRKRPQKGQKRPWKNKNGGVWGGSALPDIIPGTYKKKTGEFGGGSVPPDIVPGTS